VPEGHPWVAVRHDDRGIHIVVSRIDDMREVWHARNDYRQAQKARQAVEREHGLIAAPTRKTTPTADLPEVAAGRYDVEGKVWRVRTSRDRRKQGLVAERLGEDGQWRLVRGGVRTLAQAVARVQQAEAAAEQERQLEEQQREAETALGAHLNIRGHLNTIWDTGSHLDADPLADGGDDPLGWGGDWGTPAPPEPGPRR
jgi:hypothetical protein